MSEIDEITRLLERLDSEPGDGRDAVLQELMPLVNGELKVLARANRYRWSGVESLGTTSLVHEAYLDEACAGDGDLRRKLDELLALSDDAAEFFEQLSGEIAGAAPLELESAAGSQITIGPYRTIAAIGRGGMGAVYRAERLDGEFDQEVALKLLDFGIA